VETLWKKTSNQLKWLVFLWCSILDIHRTTFKRYPKQSIGLTMENFWTKVTDSLKERVGQQNFDIWIKPISFVSVQGDSVELEVPNRFFKEWINEHYAFQIREAVSHLTSEILSPQVRIRNARASKQDISPRSPEKKEVEGLFSGVPMFNPKYTLIILSLGQVTNCQCGLSCRGQSPSEETIILSLLRRSGIGKDTPPPRHWKPYPAESHSSWN